MKVLLFNPWQPIAPGGKEHVAVAWPTGILYVAAATQAAGHEVSIIDAFIDGCFPHRFYGMHNVCYEGHTVGDSLLVGVSAETVVMLIQTHAQPDVIGVSLPFSSQYAHVPFILQVIKTAAPDATIVFGGGHATIAPDSLLAIDGIDYVIVGEGESAFPRLLDALEGKGSVQDIPGVCYKEEGKASIMQHDIIEDLDALPLPAVNLLPIYQYFALMDALRMPMVTSRGCPNNCRFCTVPFTSRRRWRAHSVERVLGELDIYQHNDIESIQFLDDNMSLNRDRFCAILEGIITNSWSLELYAKEPLDCSTLDEEVLKIMQLAGYKQVSIAAESGNERVLAEEINKPFTVADAEKAIRGLIALDIEAIVCMVLGMPGETWAEIQDSIAFVRRMKKLGSSRTWLSIATPIPGTQLYDEVIEKGLYSGDKFSFSYGKASFDGPDWKREDLTALRDNVMKELNE